MAVGGVFIIAIVCIGSLVLLGVGGAAVYFIMKEREK